MSNLNMSLTLVDVKLVIIIHNFNFRNVVSIWMERRFIWKMKKLFANAVQWIKTWDIIFASLISKEKYDKSRKKTLQNLQIWYYWKNNIHEPKTRGSFTIRYIKQSSWAQEGLASFSHQPHSAWLSPILEFQYIKVRVKLRNLTSLHISPNWNFLILILGIWWDFVGRW